MSILNSIIKTFVGDKTKKDLKKITPLVSKINDYQKNFESFSNNQLREKLYNSNPYCHKKIRSFQKTLKVLKIKF